MVFKRHKCKVVLVIFCMLISTFSNVDVMASIQNVLDEAIKMVETGSTDFSGVAKLIMTMIILYGITIVFRYSHLRIMTDVGQDSLLHIRESLFTHMMGLPIQYFDTNKHGDVMSRYTNDVDATRQMIDRKSVV